MTSVSADSIVRLYLSIMTLHWSKSLFNWSVDMVQLRQGSGLVMDWKQSANMLVGCDYRIIEVWDAQTET